MALCYEAKTMVEGETMQFVLVEYSFDMNANIFKILLTCLHNILKNKSNKILRAY